jgi:hypothetical protein
VAFAITNKPNKTCYVIINSTSQLSSYKLSSILRSNALIVDEAFVGACVGFGGIVDVTPFIPKDKGLHSSLFFSHPFLFFFPFLCSPPSSSLSSYLYAILHFY